MVYIKFEDIRYFYRYIIKNKDIYRIKYKNKDYGEFKKLSDALYERDALIHCNFDYDLLVEYDIKNKYENMTLPPFPKKRSKGRIKGNKIKKKTEGEILFNHKIKKFYIKKEDKIYQYCDTMTEAYYIKKKLIDNHWNEKCLTPKPTTKKEKKIIS